MEALELCVCGVRAEGKDSRYIAVLVMLLFVRSTALQCLEVWEASVGSSFGCGDGREWAVRESTVLSTADSQWHSWVIQRWIASSQHIFSSPRDFTRQDHDYVWKGELDPDQPMKYI